MGNIKSDQTLEVSQPSQIRTVKIIQPKYTQKCLFCENTHEIDLPAYSYLPWVCQECQEVMVFMKDFKKQLETAKADLREKINERIYPI
jgi:hypothetical protein